MAMSFEVTNANVVVVGAGQSGRAAAELLASRGARVTLNDAAASAPEGVERLRALGIAIELGGHRVERLASADLVVLSPGVPPSEPAIAAARRAGVPVIGDVELASRWLTGRIIAITGTKGKSTTTSLTASMLREAGLPSTAGGNLGIALSAQVSASRPDVIHVVEVSSFQLEMTDTFHPWVAVLMNLSPDHLDRHASFDEYASAKQRIFRNQTADDWAVINADDPAALALAGGARARRLDFALDSWLADGVTVEDGAIVRRTDRGAEPLLPVASVRLPGRHLLTDVLAAAAVGCVAGVPPAAMRRAVEGFTGLEHTLERVGELDGVRFVNDSKATNIAAARRAIESFDDGVVAIMGGRYKGGDFAELRSVAGARADAIVTIGEASDQIRAALDPVVPVHHAASMADAVRRAFALAQPGGVVLLAPACSSFDMFADYAARGRAFKEEVLRLAMERGRDGQMFQP
jgi:UDP-N-acetylmuramoylalanine--D-glutamate ligase